MKKLSKQDDLYIRILCDAGFLKEAYQACCKGKKNKTEVQNYVRNWAHELYVLQKQMLERDWDGIFNYYNFTITRPKERSVDALEFKGRIIQHNLCDNILRPYFEPRLIKENCACREGKGTDYACKLLEESLRKIYKQADYDSVYILKMDIRKYFPSIKRAILKERLKKFPNQEVLGFLYWIIDHCPGKDGLPIGNQTSQWFALYYLDPIDRLIKEGFRIKYYVRYMDDLIIIHNDKELLKQLWKELAIYAKEKLGLEFNEKTCIIPLKEGVKFLGWKFMCNKETGKITRKIDNSKKHDRNLSVKAIVKAYERGEISFYEYNARMRSVIAHLEKGNTYNYRKKHGVYKLPSNKKKKQGKSREGNIRELVGEKD